jgi:hypothetical protein
MADTEDDKTLRKLPKIVLFWGHDTIIDRTGKEPVTRSQDGQDEEVGSARDLEIEIGSQ